MIATFPRSVSCFSSFSPSSLPQFARLSRSSYCPILPLPSSYRRHFSQLSSPLLDQKSGVSSSPSPSVSPSVGGPPAPPSVEPSSIAFQPSNRIPLFNTYKLVERLRAAGLTEGQSVILMEALVAATAEALESTQSALASKSELSALSMQLNEKIFNSTLKYDLQQKHSREMFKSEVDAVRADLSSQKKTIDSEFLAFKTEVKLNQKTEIFSLQTQLNILEKERNSEKAFYRSEVEQLENRLIKYALGFATSLGALMLTAARIMGFGGKAS